MTSMRDREFIIQLATLASVITGVALVVWELRQSREMVHVQLVHGTISEISQERSAMYGENLAQTLSTACFSPADLSNDQFFMLDAYFSNQINRVIRARVQSQIGNFETPWRTIGIAQVQKVLAFPQGPRWISQRREAGTYDKPLLDYIESVDRTFRCEDLVRGLDDARAGE